MSTGLEVDLSLVSPSLNLVARFSWSGQVMCIVGPSGAGKTTLLHILSGLRKPTHGQIRLGDDILYDDKVGINIASHRRKIAVSFQDNRLWPHYRVRQNLEYGWKRLNPAERRYDPSQIADWLGISHLLRRRVRDLSGGEAKRVAIGRALLCSPKLLLLDEPLAGLDYVTRSQTLELLSDVIRQSGIPTLIVTHQPEQLGLDEDLLLVHDGQARMVPRSYIPKANNRLQLTTLGKYSDSDMTEFCLQSACDDRQVSTTPRILGAPAQQLSSGEHVVANLASNQIVLSIAPVETVSMQNRLSGHIVRISDIPPADTSSENVWDYRRQDSASLAQCEVDIGMGISLTVTVTNHSIREFGLCKGQKIWCLFKASALQIVPSIQKTKLPPNHVDYHQTCGKLSSQTETCISRDISKTLSV